ncbi:GDSL-type esterase/lipase family protein [Sungkyunkwania multivorans]|uniref:GDSL-type esterase/lipase family protein n=1 Tax=Sungkyunkwania multivorans TaxID=1173618 RepID=A0ABW3CUD1_9FLAO
MFRAFLATGLFFLSFLSFSQEFEEEVNALITMYPNVQPKDSAIVFTGSSSIRMWHHLQTDFPGRNIINTGFGGSETSDLIFYREQLVLRFYPVKVFIYEGDNDIARGKSAKKTFRHMRRLVRKLQRKLPFTQFVIISAKPSLVRWHLKDDYLQLNRLLEKLAKRKQGVEYLNIWDAMLDKEKQPLKDIFIEDGLHMNAKGYGIWKEAFKSYL